MIPLEDNFTDVLSKAKRGLRLSNSELARRAGVAETDLSSAFSGLVNEIVLRKLAAGLGLGSDPLIALARQAWRPNDPGSIPGLDCFTAPHGETSVNAFLVTDPSSKQAVVFDTSMDARPMVQFATDHRLKIVLILLTHAHIDHVADLDQLKAKTGAMAWASEREPVSGASAFPDGRQFDVGALRISTRRTSGHARGGVTYVVEGLSRRIALVGDAIFAGSMGGGLVDYQEALRTNGTEIMSLPDDSVICPGHGPLTTVGEERAHNPFAASFAVAAKDDS